MSETPFSRVLETIAAVDRMQAQIAELTATLRELGARVDAIERRAGENAAPRGQA